MEEQNRALIIVDVQPTFCEGGTLPVAGGNALATKIADFVTEYADEYTFIVATQDWHINPKGHFSSKPDYINTWPEHGIAGTAEAELHDEIASLNLDDMVKKGHYSAAYSGFEGKNEREETLEEILRNHDIHAIDIVGIAESHCVKETALDGLRAGWPVRVLSDLVIPVTEELGQAARQEMDEAGIEQLPSNSAFGFYEEEEDTPIPGDDFTEGTEYDDFTEDFNNEDEDEYQDSVTDNPNDVEDIDLDDFDLPDELLDLDDDLDFSAEISDEDFDFSDIDFKM